VARGRVRRDVNRFVTKKRVLAHASQRSGNGDFEPVARGEGGQLGLGVVGTAKSAPPSTPASTTDGTPIGSASDGASEGDAPGDADREDASDDDSDDTADDATPDGGREG